MIKCPECERKWFEFSKAALVIEQTGKCVVCSEQTDEEWLNSCVDSCVKVNFEIEPGLVKYEVTT